MIEYNEFKYNVFDLISGMSRTMIRVYLTRLSEDFNIPLEQVKQEYNEYTGYEDYERVIDDERI